MSMSNRKKKAAIAGASLALVGMVGVGAAVAPHGAQAAQSAVGISAPASVEAQAPLSQALRQSPPAPKPHPKPGSVDPQQRQQRQQQRQQQQDQYLQAVASHLNGVTKDQLVAAMKQARIDLVNQAVTNGKLDRATADRIIQRIQSGQAGFGMNVPAENGPRAGGREAMRGGPWLAAQVLQMQPQDLRAALKSGKTLAQIAQDKGVSRDQFKQQLTDAMKSRLSQAVSQGRMTQPQADQVLQRFTTNLDRMLDFSPGQRPAPAPRS
ncbi:MAG: hypothetical protein IT305_23435 [Chloroflexi bacterium]|nr:hypothetical protein [Chloroflexota bacterium]